MEQPRFLASGDLMVDVVVSGQGHEAEASVRPGGSAAIAAAWAAEVGARSAPGGPGKAVRRLGERFRLVCVTGKPSGAVGALDGEIAPAGGGPSHVGSPQPIGARDASAAGVLVALTRGDALPGALAAGCALGARAAVSGSWPPG